MIKIDNITKDFEMTIYNKFFSYAMFCLSFCLIFTGSITARFEQEKGGVQLIVQEYINEEIPMFVETSPHANFKSSRARLKDIYPLKLAITNKSNNEIIVSPQNINFPQASMKDIYNIYNANELYVLGGLLNIVGIVWGGMGVLLAHEQHDAYPLFFMGSVGATFVGLSALLFKIGLDKNKKLKESLEKTILLAPLSIAPGKTAITFIFVDKKDPRLNPFTVTLCQKDDSEEKIEFNVIL